MKQSSFESFYAFVTNELNEPQKEAVAHARGPLLVIAGAGSGKTRVITARIAHLIIEHKVHAASIVALTFTNKAANEMKSRIGQFLGTRDAVPFVGTFHSYCLQLLKKYRHLVHLPFNSLMDADDQKKIITSILKKNNLHKQFSATTIAYSISLIKNNDVQENSIAQQFTNPLIYDIYTAYEKEKTLSACFDFDDLLVHTVALFKKNPSFKAEFHAQVRHVLVDEYQDTNAIQHTLLQLMSVENKNLIIDSICAVGDEDQSIYSWRGAHVANMLNFSKDFTGTTLIKIEQNYRSVQPILHAANTIIKNNSHRNPKKLWSDKQADDRIRLISCVSEYQEADALAHLSKLVQQHSPDKQCAVLYRTHSQSRSIEEALIKNSVPYTIIGGVQFYERKEIKDLLAYLKLIINPFDRISLLRVINTPARGLGEKFEELLHDYWSKEPFLTFTQLIRTLLEHEQLTPTKTRSLHAFLMTFAELTPTSSPSHALERIVHAINYRNYIRESHEKEDAESRLENIDELIKAARHFEQEKMDTVDLFLEEVTLLQERNSKQQSDQNTILLMTLHAAKGLEFDIVMLPGLEEQILPSSRSVHDTAALEEERRLLYVGITRAREHLLLSYAKFRSTYGNTTSSLPSRFLDELPAENIKQENCSYWKGIQFNHFFSKWLAITLPETVFTFGKPNWLAQNDNISHQVASEPMRMVKKAPPVYTPHLVAPKIEVATQTHKSSLFKVHQPVKHATYGIGIVQKEESRPDGSVSVTVKFKDGVKKIMASYLEKQ